jgi:hypothetical protein
VISKLRSARDLLKEFLESSDPATFRGEDAAEVVGLFAEIQRLGVSGQLRFARRVEDSNIHKEAGHKGAGSFLSTVTGESVSQSASRLALVRSIEAHPDIDEAFKKGRLSEARAKQLASVAEVCPDQVGSLVRASDGLDFSEFQKRCRGALAASETAEESIERYERMRRKRYCRTWTDEEGFGRLDARMTPDALAVVRSGLEPFQRAAFEKARRQRCFESNQSYAADALVAMAAAAVRGSDGHGDRQFDGRRVPGAPGAVKMRKPQRASKPLVRIRVDASALGRGRAEPGETCEVMGAGPLPVPIVASQIEDALLELVVTHGTEVVSVCTDSRHISKVLRIALEERDRECVVPGCSASEPLEVDHWETGFAKGGKTEMANLCRICPHHHDLKTYKGWCLEGGPGQWRMIRPGAPEVLGSLSRAGP